MIDAVNHGRLPTARVDDHVARLEKGRGHFNLTGALHGLNITFSDATLHSIPKNRLTLFGGLNQLNGSDELARGINDPLFDPHPAHSHGFFIR